MGSSFNRIANLRNPYQGNEKKVLALCSAGLLRSPTVAWVLSNPPYNYNTRAAGTETDYALIPLDDALIEWADEIVCVNPNNTNTLKWWAEQNDVDLTGKLIVTLDIPDQYRRRDPKLVAIIEKQYQAHIHAERT